MAFPEKHEVMINGKTTQVPVLRAVRHGSQGLPAHQDHRRAEDPPVQELQEEVHAQETEARAGGPNGKE